MLDANVVVSAALSSRPGPVRECLAIIERPGIVMAYSEEMARELADVLMRPKFDRYIPRTVRQNFLIAYLENGLCVHPIRTVEACRDPKDNHVLEAAIAANAEVIVTGDDDLLTLDPFEGVAIISPAAFVARFTERH